MDYKQTRAYFKNVNLTPAQAENIKTRFSTTIGYMELSDRWREAIKALPDFEKVMKCNIIWQEMVVDGVKDELAGRTDWKTIIKLAVMAYICML